MNAFLDVCAALFWPILGIAMILILPPHLIVAAAVLLGARMIASAIERRP